MKHELDDSRAEKYECSKETEPITPICPVCGNYNVILEKTDREMEMREIVHLKKVMDIGFLLGQGKSAGDREQVRRAWKI